MFAWRDNYISYNGASSNDPYWNNVCLLLNYEIPQTFVADSAVPTRYWIVAGSTTPRPNLRSPFASGAASSYFPASGYVYTTTAFTQAGTSNWTAECWFYPTSPLAAGQDIININGGTGDGYAQIRIGYINTGGLYMLCGVGAGSWINTSTSAAGSIVANQWNHIAGVRNGSVFTVYANGVSRLTYSSASSLYASYAGVSVIGASASALGTRPIQGFVSNFRYVLGTAVYTAAFTPPTSPLTAITNTQSLVPFLNQGSQQTNAPLMATDQGPNALTLVSTAANPSGISPFFTTAPNILPGSIYFNGSGSINAPTSSVFGYGTGDFTIEFWMYISNPATTQIMLDQRVTGSSNQIVPTVYMTGSKLYYYVGGANRIVGTTTIASNTWYAVSVCRSGTSTKIFLNGIQEGDTYTDTNNYSSTSRAVIGGEGDVIGASITGYLSNVRLSKGVAYYTTTYTPSIIPLTSDATYTSLLVSGNIASVYDLSNSFNRLISGQRTQPSIYKFGTQAGYSIASTTSVDDTTAVQFGTGDFTIEGWFYRIGSGSAVALMCQGSSTTGWRIRINASNQLVYSTASSDVKTSTTTIPASTWTYIAWTRSGSTNYMFINGTQEGAIFTNSTNLGVGQLQIGGDTVTTNFTGYTDDIRFTKGVCRYTSSFSAPTSAFPTS